jgi:quercetin 2,3-dioxygenase
MKTVIHRADTRGFADHGWLKSYHTFSFSEYYNPDRIHFGVLRVLNDDTVSGGMGFGSHPHDNMEIISIPLKGDLEHKDSMGNTQVIRQNDIQIMSAGTGIFHSEKNHSSKEPVQFLQIWIFPSEKNKQPSYDQKTFAPEDRKNKLQLVVSPEIESDTVFINQLAWFTLGHFDKGTEKEYAMKRQSNGAYVFVIEGSIEINGEILSRRDGMGITDADSFFIKAKDDSEFLIMDVPMN